MTSRSPKSDSDRRRKAEALGTARLLLVDSNSARMSLTRQWIERQGGPDAEIAGAGDEALDLLGAAAQRYDLVVVWPTLADEQDVDFFGVLRRCRSPVRLVAATPLTPPQMPRPGRLAGTAAVESAGPSAELTATLVSVLKSFETVERIVTQKRAPSTMSKTWAQAIYGTAPGQRFHAELD